MKRKEEILRNKAFRDLKKKKVYSINGNSIHETPMDVLHSKYLEIVGKKLTNRSRKFTENDCKGFIYLIETECKAFYKIGFSNDPNIRLKNIQVSCPLKVSIVNFFKGSIPVEKKLHKKLSNFSVRGEWYKHNTEVQKTFYSFKEAIVNSK